MQNLKAQIISRFLFKNKLKPPNWRSENIEEKIYRKVNVNTLSLNIFQGNSTKIHSRTTISVFFKLCGSYLIFYSLYSTITITSTPETLYIVFFMIMIINFPHSTCKADDDDDVSQWKYHINSACILWNLLLGCRSGTYPGGGG